MKRIFFVFIFLPAVAFHLHAQSETDTSKTIVSKKSAKSVLRFYLNAGASFSIGAYTVPPTYMEYNIGANRYSSNGSTGGTGIARTGVSHSAGVAYGAGLEYVPKSVTKYYNVIDLGASYCSYGGNVYYQINNYNIGSPYTTTYGPSQATAYTFAYGMAELAVYQFYRFMKKNNRSLSAGLGARITYAFFEGNPSYGEEEYNSSSTGIFASTRLRYKGKYHSFDLYFNYGVVGSSNAFSSTGIQYAFSLTYHSSSH